MLGNGWGNRPREETPLAPAQVSQHRWILNGDLLSLSLGPFFLHRTAFQSSSGKIPGSPPIPK